MYGVGYGAGTIFGFNYLGEILSLDQNTGAATVIATPGIEFWGAATNPAAWD